MNPQSNENRNVWPKVSIPAELPEYELAFYGQSGMAEVIPKPGKKVQGVAHNLDSATFEIMDKLEGVPRVPVQCKLQDGTIIEAFVYLRPSDVKRGPEIDKPPTERYLEVMVDGARYNRLPKDYINYLRNLDKQPRKKVEEFKKLSDPPTEGMPTFTLQDLKDADGKDGNPLYMSINGVVRQYLGNDKASITRYETLRNSNGPHMEFFFAVGMYDPKYGLPR